LGVRTLAIDRILIPLDGSEQSSTIAEAAAQVAVAYQSEVILLHVTRAAEQRAASPSHEAGDTSALAAAEAFLRQRGLVV